MSVYAYDKAVTDFFERITGDSIMIQPPENAIRNTAQLKGDNITFPLITLNRTSWSIRQQDKNFAMMREGHTVRFNDDHTVTQARMLPIKIEYQVDVFTVDKRMNDEITRELIWYLSLKPTLQVEVDYDVNIKHNFNLLLDPDIVDNSDVTNHVNDGVLFRSTFTMYCDDAYLWAGKDLNIPSLDVSMEVKNNPNDKESVLSEQLFHNINKK